MKPTSQKNKRSGENTSRAATRNGSGRTKGSGELVIAGYYIGDRSRGFGGITVEVSGPENERGKTELTEGCADEVSLDGLLRDFATISEAKACGVKFGAPVAGVTSLRGFYSITVSDGDGSIEVTYNGGLRFGAGFKNDHTNDTIDGKAASWLGKHHTEINRLASLMK